MSSHDVVSGEDFRLEVLVGCNGGNCPKVGRRAARPGKCVVQGVRIPAYERAMLGEIPDQEDVIEVPEETLVEYARRLLAEGRL